VKSIVFWLAIAGLLFVSVVKFQESKADGVVIQRIHTTDTVYVRDTVHLTRVRHHTDTILRTLTDTLIHRDTVIQIVERERAACDAVIQTCEARVALRDLRIKELERGERFLGIKLPSRTVMFGLGALTGAVLTR
jgi:hypothetical protein